MTRGDDFNRWLAQRHPHQPEFIQAVQEFADSIFPILDTNPVYRQARILERLTEPDRTISFRVVWQDDSGRIRINRGWRVQYNNVIGPYKGGLRFHPTVTESVLKFLGFEQTFKNALTGLPMGGAKGGADFDPSERSEAEVMRFCQAFMQELYRHIGPQIDVPAGDINVGEREIGWMYGQYKRITNTFTGVMTGKGTEYGGSPMRVEATGYGLVYFLCRMLEEHGQTIEGRRVAISGAGHVATHAAEKAIDMGARVITLSDSKGFLLCEDGIGRDLLHWLRADPGNRLAGAADRFGGTWHAGAKPWHQACDIALPCATQNELDRRDAEVLAGNRTLAVAEGANMPSTRAATDLLRERGVLFGPGKAANAGGVSLSGLEMSQNAAYETRDRDQLGERLRSIMCQIHDRCRDAGADGDRVDYLRGANIAGFRKVADAMFSFGVL